MKAPRAAIVEASFMATFGLAARASFREGNAVEGMLLGALALAWTVLLVAALRETR